MNREWTEKMNRTHTLQRSVELVSINLEFGLVQSIG